MPEASPPPRKRDARLDVLRGLALATIFINHVPGTAWEGLTSRNFGFSDAAEGFVFMAGVAAALAYSRGLSLHPVWPAVTKIWSRAWKLVMVHMTVSVIVLGVSAAAVLWFGIDQMAQINNIPQMLDDPLAGLLGLATMMHQLAYANILPLYAILLFATPGLIAWGQRAPGQLLAASVGVWLAAGTFGLAMPAWPDATTIWFLNPLSWQVVYVLGLLTGLAARRGEAFVPMRPWLVALAWGVVIAILAWARWPGLGDRLNAWMFALGEPWFVPTFLTQYDKTFVSGPRLLHFLALAYLLANLATVRRACESPLARPLAILGRHGLTVFALGTVLAIAAQAAKLWAEATGLAGFAFDTVLIWGGLALQFGVAWAREQSARMRRGLQQAAQAQAQTMAAAPPAPAAHPPLARR